MRTVIICAMQKEIEHLNPYPANVEVIQTGIGLCHTINTLGLKLATGQLSLEDRIINVGYAGSNKYEVGEIIAIDRVQRMKPSVTVPENIYELRYYPLFPEIKNFDYCLTVDDFYNDNTSKEIPAVDMELYYIKAMGFENVASFKIISDNLNYVGYESFEPEEAWKKLNYILWEIING